MRMLMLSQAGGLSDTLRAVRHQFQEGGSFILAGLLLALCVGAIVVTHYLTRRRQALRATRSAGPQKVFESLLQGLGLADDQQQLLRGASLKARLAHPSVLLLSPACFDQHVRPGGCRGQDATDLVGRTRAALFPVV